MISFQELYDTLCESGHEPRAYSGRGMMGKQCLAISNVELFMLGVELGHTLGPNVQDLTVRQDSLGGGTVIYFPKVAWEEPKDD